MPTIAQLVRKGREKVESKTKSPALRRCPQQERSMCEGLHNNSEKAELSPEKSCKGKTYECDGSYSIYTRRRAQPSGTLYSYDKRRKSKRPSGCQIPYYQGYSGFHGSYRQKTRKIKIWIQETQINRE